MCTLNLSSSVLDSPHEIQISDQRLAQCHVCSLYLEQGCVPEHPTTRTAGARAELQRFS